MLRKQLLWMSAGQALCLAVGLLIQNQYIASTLLERADGVQLQADDESIQRTAVGGPTNSQSLLAISGLTFGWIMGLQGVIAFLVLSSLGKKQRRQEAEHDQHSLRNTRDLVRTRDAVVFGLAKLAESRDPDTGQHLERIAYYSQQLARAAARTPQYGEKITPSFIRLLGVSSALHDIGKVAVEDSILLKPGKLTHEERQQMQTHTDVGARCIGQIASRLGDSNFLQMAEEIASYHHECWDGSGYPHGLAGEQIPLAARIVAIADVYDALSVRRVYKEAIPHDECVNIIRSLSGTQFDPGLVEVFLQVEAEFRRIAVEFADADNGRSDADATEEQTLEFKVIAARQDRIVSDVLRPHEEKQALAVS